MAMSVFLLLTEITLYKYLRFQLKYSNSQVLLQYHQTLSKHLGPLNWWPAETPFEVCLGAILTQNTSWKNVAKAIGQMKELNLLNVEAIANMSEKELAPIIRSSGYYNQKAKKIKNFAKYFISRYDGKPERMAQVAMETLREELLEIKGIGPETADSILLYALNKPSFVVDTYARRIFSRHGLVDDKISYEDLRKFCMNRLATDYKVYNEFHAQLVYIGHHYCKRTPDCQPCPLQQYLPTMEPEVSYF